ncbi:MAG: hypothetical protein CSB06_00830 [Bacteroidia bacterium]|nr:MAG: hypothetical protein CSB06_00830 [Bacteroidia bacterium]
MSHGNLSPRQKMINMMYLILTALLALNVSAEILNAFVLVNDSLIKTEANIGAKNSEIYAGFASKNEANPAKVGPWKAKADEIGKISSELVEYINNLEKTLLTQAGENYDLFKKKGAIAIEKKSDQETPTRVMLEEKGQNGKLRSLELKAKIIEYQKTVKNIFKGIDGSETLIKNMDSNLNTDDIKGSEGNIVPWHIAVFHQLPLVASITMLTKLKTDILNTESDAIANLYSQVDAKSYKFTDLNAIVKAEKGYLLAGERYTAQIFVGASDSTQKPEIILDNGKRVDSFDNMKRGIYSVQASGYGEHVLKGNIVVNKPGSTEKDSFPFETSYLVAAPSVSVSADKMNVFYIGVDNPVTVTAAGTPASAVSASISTGRILKKSGSQYVVRVRKGPKARVSVSANGRTLGTKVFRVKRVPDPVATLGPSSAPYYKGGPIPKSTLAALSGPRATMENFDFDLKFKITSFSVSCTIGGFDEISATRGSRISAKQKALIRKAKRNSRVIIENIRAKGPDGSVRKLNDLVFKLK